MVTDPISDFFTRVRNAMLARKKELVLPYSRLKEEIARVLLKGGYLEQVTHEGDQLALHLSYVGGQPRITEIKTITRPGLRVYKKAKELRATGGAMIIVSTPHGIMTGKEALKEGMGGEVLAEVR